MQKSIKNVLIIDDDPILRKIVSTALGNKGYKTYTSEDTECGSTVLHANPIDIVLCDIMLKGEDGFEFCKKVRNENKYKTLPFIFISSKDSIQDKEYALSLGADDFITKPVNTDELYIKMEALFKRLEIYKIYGVREKIEEKVEERAPMVLLVDDDIFIKKVLEYGFKEAGLECITAESSLEGLEKAKTYKPDIILSDLMMPEVDGFEFRKLTLKEPALRDIPFIFLTSVSDESAMLKGYDLDIKDYIVKTSNPKLISIRVRNLIQNIRKERKKALNELQEAASNISMEVIPSSAPKFDGFDMKHWHVPFKGIPGGDFIDYIKVDDDKMCVILGDIMGKQWGAWFFAFSFIGYIRSAVRISINSVEKISAGEILKRVNETVFKDAKISEIFTTVSCLILDNKQKYIEYSGAGDLSVLRLHSSTKEITEYSSEGLLLGISPDGNYSNIEIKPDTNDELYLFTDGIVESRNRSGNEFGMTAIKDTIKNNDAETDGLENIKKAFSSYTDNNFEDDITLIKIKVL